MVGTRILVVCASFGLVSGCEGEQAPTSIVTDSVSTCVDLAASGDSTVSILEPRRNFGSEQTLRVGLLSESLLQFDLGSIPGGAQIQSAGLKLFVANADPRPVRVHRVTRPWLESTVTFWSFAQHFDPSVSGSFSATHSNTVTSVDLTAPVTEWVAGTTPNDGILLRSETLDAAMFASRESVVVARRPTLSVCYTLPDAALSVSPSSTDFGSVAFGASSDTVTFAATNTGGISTGILSEDITGTDAASFVIASSTCIGVTLAPSASCNVSVRFAPATVGSKVASLTLSSGPTTASASLLGTGDVPTPLTYDPSPVAFGNVFAGDTKDLTISVQNPAGGLRSPPVTFDLSSGNPSCSGDPEVPTACFALLSPVAGDCISGLTALDAGGTCNLRVRFDPTHMFGAINGTIDIGNSSPLGTISVTGTGLSTIAVDPTFVDFGFVPELSDNDQTFTVTNVSDENQTPVAVSFSGASFDLFVLDNTCVAELPPLASCQVTVDYFSGIPGAVTDGFLEIFTNNGFSEAEILGENLGSGGD